MVYLVEHHNNLIKEKAGTHIIVYRDESYVHQMYNGDYSLLFRDDNGNLISNIPMAVRNGRRVCFAGCITKCGQPVVTKMIQRSGYHTPTPLGWIAKVKRL